VARCQNELVSAGYVGVPPDGRGGGLVYQSNQKKAPSLRGGLSGGSPRKSQPAHFRDLTCGQTDLLHTIPRQRLGMWWWSTRSTQKDPSPDP